jgi:hypothetical protein
MQGFSVIAWIYGILPATIGKEMLFAWGQMFVNGFRQSAPSKSCSRFRHARMWL